MQYQNNVHSIQISILVKIKSIIVIVKVKIHIVDHQVEFYKNHRTQNKIHRIIVIIIATTLIEFSKHILFNKSKILINLSSVCMKPVVFDNNLNKPKTYNHIAHLFQIAVFSHLNTNINQNILNNYKDNKILYYT